MPTAPIAERPAGGERRVGAAAAEVSDSFEMQKIFFPSRPASLFVVRRESSLEPRKRDP